MLTADELVRAARVRLAHPTTGTPYLSAALWTMRLVPDERCPTMGVDQHWNCYYNPALIQTWPVETIATVLVHEIWHLLRGHHGRAAALGISTINADAWNVAADEEINDGEWTTRFKFPPGLTPISPALMGHPDGLLAEEYYHRLPRANLPMCGIGGSASDGIARPWEAGGGRGEKGTNTRVIPEELIRQCVAGAISKDPGTLPGNWKRWAGQVIQPKIIPWQTILRAVVGRIVAVGRRDDWTFSRPARRAIVDAELILPGQTGTLPEILVIGDTSGSMGEAALGETAGIVASVLEFLGRVAPITFIAGDTCMQSCKKVSSAGTLDFRGGGGTDMRALIAHALTLRPRPQVIVVVTDGYTPWPERAPVGMQTVVVLVDKGESPTWATTVRIK